jgi:hypothetical protein
LILDDIRNLRQQLKNFGRVETNVFSDDVLENADELYHSEKSILISSVDCNVRRLYYYTVDFNLLRALIPLLKNQEYVLEFLTRNADEKSVFLRENGFSLLAQMMRVSTLDCAKVLSDPSVSQYTDDSMGLYPDSGLCLPIDKKLHEIFDSRVSHLLNDAGLNRTIENGEITIHQDSVGNVDAILQVVVQPKRFYINQIYNGSEKKVIHAMLQKRLRDYVNQGGKYVYAWVEKNNVASVKFHEKYGMKFDGLWNMVYVLKK